VRQRIRRACTHCSGKTSAHSIATRLSAVPAEPVWLGGKSVYTSGSIGVPLPGELPSTPADVMRDADAAMRTAKRRGKGRYELFDATMRGRALERIELEADLRCGLETEELIPYFQPLVDVQTGAIRGVEALVRWQHPQRGLVPPGDVVPICEEAGLMVPLGRRVLREACHQVQRWREWFGIDLRLSVNLSVAELDRHDLLDAVTAVLDETGADPGTLCLEITEHALMTEASHCSPNLAALDQLGVVLTLDDFGTGYSSLAHLRKLPIGILKIDRSFMTGDVLSPADAASSRRSSGSPARSACGRSPRASRPRTVGRAQAPRLRVQPGLPVEPPAAGGRDRRPARPALGVRARAWPWWPAGPVRKWDPPSTFLRVGDVRFGLPGPKSSPARSALSCHPPEERLRLRDRRVASDPTAAACRRKEQRGPGG
jgi:EAL domain-containing protein (putative c-di-GMP-specific phosphodiesterase class I)